MILDIWKVIFIGHCLGLLKDEQNLQVCPPVQATRTVNLGSISGLSVCVLN